MEKESLTKLLRAYKEILALALQQKKVLENGDYQGVSTLATRREEIKHLINNVDTKNLSVYERQLLIDAITEIMDVDRKLLALLKKGLNEVVSELELVDREAIALTVYQRTDSRRNLYTGAIIDETIV